MRIGRIKEIASETPFREFLKDLTLARRLPAESIIAREKELEDTSRPIKILLKLFITHLLKENMDGVPLS